ncbi:2OG-Fe(II) oxygenase [Achromobacter seleniivolatilans]|uniref:2OG-Fe(II) oxygenase n=1 Tax=Achromobacter seleniivolatilans TaxID=3047478 RepID=A0ABY9M7C2_9BURK|nr:2OG-Fe(II) oxygenase [Achromobacter sp. R39]WMD22503.1 2OG-Fe(II) oxygenase [Achromobacter sp. R39]
MITEKYSIDPDWRNWIDTCLKKGCDKTEVFTRAIKGGGINPDTAFALTYGEQKPRPKNKVWSNIQSNKIQLSDREVNVIFQSIDPEIIVFGNVLSDEECDSLIELSKQKVIRSLVVGADTGNPTLHYSRTSESCSYQRGATSLHTAIEERISQLVNIPVENGEGLQVLNYRSGQEYKAHYDYFTSPKSIELHCKTAGQRTGTFIIYLSDVEAGGQTTFPKLGISVAPKKGNGLFFSYMNEQGDLDDRSFHSGHPVIEGEKWICTKWLRERPYFTP